MASKAAIIVPAVKRHTATVIMSHGLGDSGAGWIFLAQNWRKRGKFEEVSFIFPNAPSIPITLNMGLSMPGWYDILSLDDINGREDETGILKSQAVIHKLVTDEVAKGIPSERIVLGGFSQGGALSIFAGLTCPQKLGGIVGLSAYLLLRNKLADLIPKEGGNKATKIFMGHGSNDMVVQYRYGQRTAEALKGLGYDVDFKTYQGMDHGASPEEIDDLETWLNTQIPPLGDGGAAAAAAEGTSGKGGSGSL